MIDRAVVVDCMVREGEAYRLLSPILSRKFLERINFHSAVLNEKLFFLE